MQVSLGYKYYGKSIEKSVNHKLDIEVNGSYQVELFSIPNPPKRQSYPEASGLRHLAFEVEDVEEWITYLLARGIKAEPVRIDTFTNKRFTFFNDPDGLPIEIYED